MFGYGTKVVRLLWDIGFAFDPGRAQYNSTAVLKELARAAPPEAIKVLGIAEVDLFIPIFTHVYGEAQLGGKSCIVSTYRLCENTRLMSGREAFQMRVVKEAAHELGHTFRLYHCRDRACVMHYCHNVMDVDRKSDQLCRYCKTLLEDEKRSLAQE